MSERNDLNKIQKPRENNEYTFKLFFVYYLYFLFFLIFFIRLFYLQIIKGSDYEKQALNNHQQVMQIPSPRGRILIDSGNTVIAENKKSFSIYFDPRSFPYDDRKKGLEMIDLTASTLGMDKQEIVDMVNRARRYQYKSFLLKPDVSFEKLVYIAEHEDIFPGLDYENTPMRSYPYGQLYGHLTGYINKISPEQYLRKRNYGYSRDSYIGLNGMEAQYDLELRGKDGKKVKVIDSKNRIVDEYFTSDGKAISGNDIVLTIDSRIQGILKKVMDGYTGVAIVSRASTGEILGMYSYPTFNPNTFIEPDKYNEEILESKNNKNNPYINRAIQAMYPPSSTFKIVMSAAGLKNGMTFYNDHYQCNGSITIGNQKYRGMGTNSSVDMYHAIAYSCNIFFYLTGLRIGPLAIEKMSNAFGLGELTGIDLPYEKAGRIPTPRWKNDHYGVLWWDGDTANLSIGQGYVLVTPLQMNMVIANIANGGVAYTPHLLKEIRSNDNKEVLYTYKKKVQKDILLNEEEISNIQKGLKGVTTIGTAQSTTASQLDIRGKTGTAQNVTEVNHSWFVSYVPFEKDDHLAVTVFVEQGLGGSVVAAPFSTSIEEAIILYRDPHEVYRRLMRKNRHQIIYEEWLRVKGYQK